jgi:hypothetical protein
MIEVVAFVAGLVVVFVAGYRVGRRRARGEGWVYIIYGIPRDLPGVGIPPTRDEQRWS